MLVDFLYFCGKKGHNGVAEGGCVQVRRGLGDLVFPSFAEIILQ